ncbi:hypothetical protein TorRG33x02_124740 [Trema orientale]|uniref:Uncharacterized protein n=1 Tax=Trema orientale TaxID=63057 RepID=A0A2P5F1H8_TREOI|nr:hypothetical protein TorRG33x02_124740 [Trema orientale]
MRTAPRHPCTATSERAHHTCKAQSCARGAQYRAWTAPAASTAYGEVSARFPCSVSYT